PVVAQPFIVQRRVLHELVHRQELDRGDAEPLQVFDRGGVGHAGVAAADLLGNFRVRAREALDVCLVYDGAVPGRVGPAVVAPVEVRIDDDRLGDVRGAVLIVTG